MLSFHSRLVKITCSAAIGMGVIYNAPIYAQSIKQHPAAISDQPIDKEHPARMGVIAISSSGSLMNGVFYIAAGAGLHPTLLLLHGTPGNEQPIDLAQAARRSGWNVLTFHYRGSWGSEGFYNITNAKADTDAAMAFLHDAENASKFSIDVKKIAIAGHSTGGYNTAYYAAKDHSVRGAALLDPWNSSGELTFTRETQIKALANEHALSIQSPAAYVDDYLSQRPIIDFASSLTDVPLLIVGAERANGPRAEVLAAKIRELGGTKLQAITLPTDHPFSDQRMVLTNIFLNWLESIK